MGRESAATHLPGVLDLPFVLFTPRSVFLRVENRSGGLLPLLAILIVSLSCAEATLMTGLPQASLEQDVRKRIAQVEEQATGVLEKSVFRVKVQDIRKQAVFELLMLRAITLFEASGWILVWVLGLAALLFGWVSLRGVKAEWYTLLSLVSLAAMTDAVRRILELVLRVQHGSLEVGLTLAAAVQAFSQNIPAPARLPLEAAAGAISPFDLWFWVLLRTGLVATRQLGRWSSLFVCVGCWLASALAKAGLAYAALSAGGR